MLPTRPARLAKLSNYRAESPSQKSNAHQIDCLFLELITVRTG